jgi:hypothetical protein
MSSPETLRAARVALDDGEVKTATRLVERTLLTNIWLDLDEVLELDDLLSDQDAPPVVSMTSARVSP